VLEYSFQDFPLGAGQQGAVPLFGTEQQQAHHALFQTQALIFGQQASELLPSHALLKQPGEHGVR
jgi:hypothetical protein